MFTVFIGHKTI